MYFFCFILLLFSPPQKLSFTQTDPPGDSGKDCSADYAVSKSPRVLVGEVEGNHRRALRQQGQNEKPNLCSRSSWSCWIIASRLSLPNFYLLLSLSPSVFLSLAID